MKNSIVICVAHLGLMVQLSHVKFMYLFKIRTVSTVYNGHNIGNLKLPSA